MTPLWPLQFKSHWNLPDSRSFRGLMGARRWPAQFLNLTFRFLQHRGLFQQHRRISQFLGHGQDKITHMLRPWTRLPPLRLRLGCQCHRPDRPRLNFQRKPILVAALVPSKAVPDLQGILMLTWTRWLECLGERLWQQPRECFEEIYRKDLVMDHKLAMRPNLIRRLQGVHNLIYKPSFRSTRSYFFLRNFLHVLGAVARPP